MSLLLLLGGLGVPPPVTGPVRHARAGVCEAGATWAGLVPYRLRITIGGVERGTLIDGFQITHTVGQPSSCTLRAHGFAIAIGQEVRITDDGAENLLFGGTIMQRRRRVQNHEPTIYELLCADWMWLANKHTRIFERFDNLSANTAVRRVLDYADPALGLRTGYLPESLGPVTVSLQGDTIETGLSKVASAADAHWMLNPFKRVDMFRDQPPHANALQLHDATSVKNLVVEEFLAQVRTRVWYEGGGSPTTALVPAGASTIPVAECGWYATTGGALRTETSVPFAYAGKTAATGPGLLTGVTGLAQDIPLEAQVNIIAQRDDAGKQTALAGILGGGLSGVVIHYQADNRISFKEADGRAQQHLSFYGEPTNQVSATVGHQVPNGRQWQAGRLIDVDVTDPESETVAGTFRLASVVIQGMADAFTEPDAQGRRSLIVERHITSRPGVRQGVVDLLVGA